MVRASHNLEHLSTAMSSPNASAALAVVKNDDGPSPPRLTARATKTIVEVIDDSDDFDEDAAIPSASSIVDVKDVTQEKDERIQELEDLLAKSASDKNALEGSLAASMSKIAMLEGLAAQKNYDSQVNFLMSVRKLDIEEIRRLRQENADIYQENGSLNRQMTEELNDHHKVLGEALAVKDEEIGNLREENAMLKAELEDAKSAQMDPGEIYLKKKRKKTHGK